MLKKDHCLVVRENSRIFKLKSIQNLFLEEIVLLFGSDFLIPSKKSQHSFFNPLDKK